MRMYNNKTIVLNKNFYDRNTVNSYSAVHVIGVQLI